MTEVCLGLRRSAFSVDTTRPLTSSSPAAMSWPSTSGQTTAWSGVAFRRPTRPTNPQVCLSVCLSLFHPLMMPANDVMRSTEQWPWKTTSGKSHMADCRHLKFDKSSNIATVQAIARNYCKVTHGAKIQNVSHKGGHGLDRIKLSLLKFRQTARPTTVLTASFHIRWTLVSVGD